ncbi:MAG TPA: Hint domain-containing protein [Oligoflexia bacterium]|nr:Hint domain-containing protein [Oligoflexia bacterium]
MAKKFLSSFTIAVVAAFVAAIVLMSSPVQYAFAGEEQKAPPVEEQANDNPQEAADDNPEAQEGDIVGEEIFRGNETTGTAFLAEETDSGTSQDCGELADYYRYQEERNDVRCTRTNAATDSESCDYYCYKVRNMGCFAPETQITMGDGLRTKAISSIRQGDTIWNPALNKAVRVAMIVRGPEPKPLYEIRLGEKTIRVSETHPMAVLAPQAGGFQRASLADNRAVGEVVRMKKANEITTADRLLGADGSFYPVTSVRTLPVDPNQEVINLELAVDSPLALEHLVAANGIATGDYAMQEKISR